MISPPKARLIIFIKNKKIALASAAFAVIGIASLIIVSAASANTSLELESSNTTGLSIVNDELASNNKYVEFNEPAAATSDIKYGLWAELREEEMFELTSTAFIKLGNGANSNPGIQQSIETIAKAREEGVALIVNFVPASIFSNPCGGTPGSNGCSGKYFHDKYLSALDDWEKPAASEIRSAVQEAVDDGIIQYAYVADEPSRKDRYSYTGFSNAYIDEISQRYKQIFPGIKTTIRQQSKQFGKTAKGDIAYGRDAHTFKHLDSVIAFSHPDRVAAARKVSGKGKEIGGWTDSEQQKITTEWMEADMQIQLSNGIPETIFGIQTVSSRTHANVDITTSRTKAGGSAHKIMTSPRWIRNQVAAMAQFHTDNPAKVSPLIIQFRYDRAPGEHSYTVNIPKIWEDDLKIADDYPAFKPQTMLEAITQIHDDLSL